MPAAIMADGAGPGLRRVAALCTQMTDDGGVAIDDHHRQLAGGDRLAEFDVAVARLAGMVKADIEGEAVRTSRSTFSSNIINEPVQV